MRYIPYLTFNGHCREAFEFYAKVFDGEIRGMFSHADSPMADEIPKELHGRIMNAYMVADGAELMGADSMPHAGGDVRPAGFCVSIHLEDEAHAKRIFDAFAEGGTIVMPYGPTFWARQFGMVTDRYGTPWMINCGMIQQEEQAA